VVRVARGHSLWQDNDLRCLKANLVSDRVKPIGNWLCIVVEATISASIWWIRLIICIWIIVPWVVVSCLWVFTCLVDVCIFGYIIVCNGTINHFSILAYPFCLFVCSVCRFLLLRWSSIYWCKQMRELLVVVKKMEIMLLSSSWNESRLSEFFFLGCSPCITLLLQHWSSWILLNLFSVFLLTSWCVLGSFLVYSG